jgi:hypothetical protein
MLSIIFVETLETLEITLTHVIINLITNNKIVLHLPERGRLVRCGSEKRAIMTTPKKLKELKLRRLPTSGRRIPLFSGAISASSTCRPLFTLCLKKAV